MSGEGTRTRLSVLLDRSTGARARVETLPEASAAVRSYLDENGLGASDWDGGEISEGGRVIARVGYNGRIWPAGQDVAAKGGR